MIPKVTLEQWAVFKAIVDEGSFAAAAEALNKSQSTVSYTLSKLDERLPSPIFEQSGRKAQLTDFGKALYRHASNLLDQAQQLDQTAGYLASGWEAEVTLAIDAIAPMSWVFCALNTFSTQHPQTRIRILETTLSGTEDVLLKREADIVIAARVPPGFLYDNYCDVVKIAVAGANHPLTQSGEALTEDALKRHRQIVIRDSGVKRSQDAGWLGSEQRWTVSHFATSIEAVKAGLGFAFIPKEKITRELENGELRRINLVKGSEQRIPTFLIVSAQDHAGPATNAVSQCLMEHKKRYY